MWQLISGQAAAGHYGILEQAGNLKLAKLNQKTSVKFLTQ